MVDYPKFDLFLRRLHAWQQPYCVRSAVYSLAARTDTRSSQGTDSPAESVKILAALCGSPCAGGVGVSNSSAIANSLHSSPFDVTLLKTNAAIHY